MRPSPAQGRQRPQSAFPRPTSASPARRTPRTWVQGRGLSSPFVAVPLLLLLPLSATHTILTRDSYPISQQQPSPSTPQTP